MSTSPITGMRNSVSRRLTSRRVASVGTPSPVMMMHGMLAARLSSMMRRKMPAGLRGSVRLYTAERALLQQRPGRCLQSFSTTRMYWAFVLLQVNVVSMMPLCLGGAARRLGPRTHAQGDVTADEVPRDIARPSGGQVDEVGRPVAHPKVAAHATAREGEDAEAVPRDLKQQDDVCARPPRAGVTHDRQLDSRRAHRVSRRWPPFAIGTASRSCSTAPAALHPIRCTRAGVRHTNTNAQTHKRNNHSGGAHYARVRT